MKYNLAFLVVISIAISCSSVADKNLIQKVEDLVVDYNAINHDKILLERYSFNPTSKILKKYSSKVKNFIYIHSWTNLSLSAPGTEFYSLLYDLEDKKRYYAYSDYPDDRKIIFNEKGYDFTEADTILKLYLDGGIDNVSPLQAKNSLEDYGLGQTIILEVSTNESKVYRLNTIILYDVQFRN